MQWNIIVIVEPFFQLNICQKFVEVASLEKERTRKAPNAFHFRRQIMITQRSGAGNSENQFQDIDFNSPESTKFSTKPFEQTPRSCSKFLGLRL